MTNTTPPGWYPDPWNRSAQRFWDGGQWTEHIAAANGPAERRRLPEDAPIYGPLIWVLALLPLLGAVVVWFIHVDVAQYVESVRKLAEYDGTGPAPMLNPFAIFGAGYWVALALNPLLYAAQIVLAAFDRRRLAAIGLERPFHWGWAFFGGIVYVIGRSVIVRRAASPRGLAPIWVTIGAYVVTIISGSIWAATFMGELIRQLNDVANALPTA